MATKFLAAVCLFGLMVLPNAAWSARMTRGECINAVHQKLGSGSTDAARFKNRDAVIRCLKYGPDAIVQ
jgi:hypothetical protein